MTVSELIEKLREKNTGPDTNVYLRDAEGRLWDVGLDHPRVDWHGPPPYRYDDNYPFQMTLVPQPLYRDGGGA